MTQILGLAGSLRKASSSKAVLGTLLDGLPGHVGHQIARIDDIPPYDADHDGGAPVARLIAQIRQADGLVFVTPEYNYSVPGVLKNAIDWASRPAFESVFKGKKCLVISTSGGALGGVRAQGHLKYILHGMLAQVFPAREVVVPFANAKIEGGRLTDAAILEFAGATLGDFVAWLG